MITIPSMPTRFRPLPELELDLDVPRLRKLAGVLDRVKIDSKWRAGLCFAVSAEASVAVQYEFERAVSRGMNKYAGRHCVYLYQYLGEDDIALTAIRQAWVAHITLEELTAIRQAWAAHIARSIYEQIGA